MPVKLAEPLIYSGRSLPFRSILCIQTPKGQQYTTTAQDNRWLDLHHDHGGSCGEIMADRHMSLFLGFLSFKLLLPLSSIYHQGFHNCRARGKWRQSTLLSKPHRRKILDYFLVSKAYVYKAQQHTINVLDGVFQGKTSPTRWGERYGPTWNNKWMRN